MQTGSSMPWSTVTAMSKERAQRIKVLLFDVDGVLTDGKIFLMPAPAGAQQHPTAAHAATKANDGGYAIVSDMMIESKGFNAHDGTGISLARLGGIRTGVITKRISEAVRLRARDLKLDFVYQGIADKASCFEEICREAGVTAQEVAFVGDDIIDLPVMRRCGLAIAVANARESVKDEAHVVVDHVGGDGAARDAIEYILKAQGKLDRVVEEYLGERSPKSIG
jgi:3-deoxy-D-manno-octulosonate 8-phosphate phosphatase (KDO 8-P phosphatase)